MADILNNEQKEITEAVPATVREKMDKETENYVSTVPELYRETAKQQITLVMDGIVKMADEDDTLYQAIMQPHKTFKRCYSFMEKKAKEMAGQNAQSCAVISTALFEWIKEYYMLDDKEEIEKAERAKALAAAKRLAAAKAKKASKSDLEITIEESKKKAAEYEAKKKAEAEEKRIAKAEEKRNCAGQMDLFSMFS